MHGNVFHNPWDRVIAVADRKDAAADGMVLDGNLFLDSDWDREVDRHRPWGSGDRKDGGGAFEIVRILGGRHIVRDNVFAGGNIGNGWDCGGAMSLTSFSDADIHTVRYEGLRVYDNTFVDNARSGIGVSRSDIDVEDSRDNRFERNVFVGNAQGAMTNCSDTAEVGTWVIDQNIVAPSDLVTGFEAATGDNPRVEVHLEDRDGWRSGWSLADLGAQMVDFALVDPDPPPPLARVTADVDESYVVPLDDATLLWDGAGMTQGDSIRIGDEQALIVAIIDPTTVEVDRPITTSANAPVDRAHAHRRAGVQPR